MSESREEIIKSALITSIVSVLNQGEPSISLTDISMCVYRGEGGLKCAVGHLIKDEHYTDSLESSNLNNVNVVNALALSLGLVLSTDEKKLFQLVQRAHDQYSGLDECRKKKITFTDNFTKMLKFYVSAGVLPQYIETTIKTWVMESDAIKKSISVMIEQNRPSLKVRAHDNPNHIPTCMYRGEDGSKCAIGILITDDVLAEHRKLEPFKVGSMEPEGKVIDFEAGGIIEELLARSLGMELPLNRTFKGQVGRLQQAHDNSSSSPNFTEVFKDRLFYAVSKNQLPRYVKKFVEEIKTK